MTENPLDPRMEKLVALLYGELSAEEERLLRLQIESDPALRAEWESLGGTRSLMQAWENEDAPPQFVFLQEDESKQAVTRVIRPATGWRARMRGLLLGSGWAVAAAAIVVALLAANDFRVVRKDGALTFRFGAPAEQLAANNPVTSYQPQGVPLEMPQSQAAPGGIEATDPLIRQASAPYLTREEFEAYNAGMAKTMIALLNEYGRQQDQEVAGVLTLALGEIAAKQGQDYDELRSRIEAMRLGMGDEQYRRGQQVDYLMEQNQVGETLPVSQSPEDETKGDEK